MFAIRRFRMEDLHQAMRLVEETFREHYEPQMYLNLQAGWPDGLLVAENDGQMVGFLLGMVSAPRQVRVLLLTVRPEYWNQGLGRQLLWTFMASARPFADSITLEVRVSNQRALSFYYRLGFVMTGMIPHYYRDGESAHVMVRSLW